MSANRSNNTRAKARTPASRGRTLDRAVATPVFGAATTLGHIDAYGYAMAAGGWIFIGWTARPSRLSHDGTVACRWEHDGGTSRADATIVYYERLDLDSSRIGVIVFAPGSGRLSGLLRTLAFEADGMEYRARSTSTTLRLHRNEPLERASQLLTTEALAGANRDALLRITNQRGFIGDETLSAGSEPIQLELDQVVVCAPDGLLIKGWMLSPDGAIRCARVRSGPLSADVDFAKALKIPRPDVMTAVGSARGYSDPNCGFVLYVPHAYSPGDDTYLEVEYGRSEVGFKWIRPLALSGLPAIRTVLDGLDLGRSDLDLDHAFDAVLGPAITALNVDRLTKPVTVEEIAFGAPPRKPKASLVIPLYGRIDYLDYQMALNSTDPAYATHDIIYVLDDPPRRAELLTLAESVFERFRIPFRVLIPSANVGFGPASNLGLEAARAPYVAFVNSDVFPITPNAVGHLIATLASDRTLGAIGPRLLFDDGSIQHEGCVFKPLREHGHWHFVDHPNKGRRPAPADGFHPCEVITGAYLVMSRALAVELGGFDRRYVVGDFEDSDLCLRIRETGLQVGVDRGVEAYHLERQSQVAPSTSWRRNLTLYNAWQHERRWFAAPSPTSARLQSAERKARIR